MRNAWVRQADMFVEPLFDQGQRGTFVLHYQHNQYNPNAVPLGVATSLGEAEDTARALACRNGFNVIVYIDEPRCLRPVILATPKQESFLY